MKSIVILGSTGSIGTQTLEVVRAGHELKAAALAACSNIDLLEQQIREFRPSLVCVFQEKKAKELRLRISDLAVKVVFGMEGLIECAVLEEAQIVVAAIVGMVGIQPVIAAIEAGRDIALANKETLVTAGHIIMPLIKEKKVRLLPVDSEHSAIFQCLKGEDGNKIHKILLTASGGPFRSRKRKDLEHIKPEDALCHPNWSMGKKITIDSSTLINKGLEVIEAKWLFELEYEQIEVVIQPQSVIHSMVEFEDGAVIAQLGTPDMKLPIQYALYYPERRFSAGERLNFWDLKEITFEKPDTDTFYGLRLAYDAGKAGGSVPAVFNAANEWAVAEFLENRIKYLEIPEIIAYAVQNHRKLENPDISEILSAEKQTYDLLKTRWG